MDTSVYQESFADKSSQFEFEQRTILSLPDQQNGNYQTGAVSWDLSSFASSDLYPNWSEAVATIPLVMNVTGWTGSATTSAQLTADRTNAFAMNLKSNLHLVNSLSIQINGTTYQNLTNYANIDATYKILSGFSTNDVKNLGATLNFAKDEIQGFTYGVAGSANYGIGECNNSITGALPTPAGGFLASTVGTSNNYNNGRMQRCMNTSFDPTVTNMAKLIKSTTELTNENKSYCAQSNSADEVVYYVLAEIPLKFMSSLIANLGMLRGAKITMQMQLNAPCYYTFQSNATATVGFGSGGFAVSTPFTLPFQLSAPLYNSTAYGINCITGGGIGLIASIGICKAYKSYVTTFATAQTNCQITVPFYKLSPAYEESLLKVAPVRHVVYNDLYQAMNSNLAADTSFTWTLPFNPSRMRYLLLCPYLCALNNGASPPSGTSGGKVIGSPIVSPFSSAPNTVTPYVKLTQFNVFIGGTAVYTTNVNYSWQQFLFENRQSNNINGGSDVGLSSGIIDFNDFECGYGFVFVDLSRHSLATDNISKTIQISATNSSLVPIDLYAFVGYERDFSINISNGQIAQM